MTYHIWLERTPPSTKPEDALDALMKAMLDMEPITYEEENK